MKRKYRMWILLKRGREPCVLTDTQAPLRQRKTYVEVGYRVVRCTVTLDPPKRKGKRK